MTKKRILPLGLLGMAAVGTALIIALSSGSEVAQAGFCGPDMQTGHGWGLGDTCAEATQDLFNEVLGFAAQTCGGSGNVCNAGLVITHPCAPTAGGRIHVDGHLIHGCLMTCSEESSEEEEGDLIELH